MALVIDKSQREQQLVEACRRNDRKAQRELYERYSGRMLSICIRYIPQRDQAEDIMITGLMKIFDKIGQFKGDGSFEGWMRRIMVNEALGHIRKTRNMYIESSIDGHGPEPDYHLLEDHLEAEDLMKLVAELPVGYRTVFNLYAIEGFSHKEIGEMLQIQETTSKSQLSRARSLLQKSLVAMDQQLKLKINSLEKGF
jgi:RNA polymerase sigma factor (sigma-70 family)